MSTPLILPAMPVVSPTETFCIVSSPANLAFSKSSVLLPVVSSTLDITTPASFSNASISSLVTEVLSDAFLSAASDLTVLAFSIASFIAATPKVLPFSMASCLPNCSDIKEKSSLTF